MYVSNRAANVAITTAICALPVFGMVGVAIDYSIALSVKSKLDAAAQAAAIAAITTAQNAIQGGSPTDTGITQGITQGAKVFAANAGSVPFGTVPTPQVTITASGLSLTANVSYQAATASSFGKLFGISQLNLQGSTASTLSLTTYINYYILVDISQSMGIGATAADMQALFNRVVAYNNGFGTGCVFACHVAENNQTYANEDLAHNTKYGATITLRIDSAIAAIQSIITQAKASAGTTGNIKIGIYTMSDDPVTGSLLNKISDPTSDYTSLAGLAVLPTVALANSQVPPIDLGNNVAGGSGDTDFPDSLSAFNAILPANGTGISADSPLNYVFLVTDGVQDTPGSSCTFGHCVQAMSSSLCAPLKQKATVGVIYTTYLPIYKNNDQSQGYDVNYQQLVLPIVSAVPGNLLSCASAQKYYYEASDGPTIATAMQQLFASTSALARLTQ